MWVTSNWLERNKILIRCGKYSTKKLIGRTNLFLRSCLPGVHSKIIWNKQRYCWQLQNHVWNQNFCRSNGKLPCSENLRVSSWSYDMEGHVKKCVERYCELTNKTTQQPYKVSTPCVDDHHFKEEELKYVGELSQVCSQIVLKCLYLARIGRPDILWSVNKLARSITKWTKACDKRLNRLISYIHHTCEYKQYCHVGNTAKQCRLGLFQDSDFAGDLEDSKSTSGGTLCMFWKSYIYSNKMDVQETNFSFAQFNRIRNHLFGRRIEIGRYTPHLIYGMWSSQFFMKTRIRVIKHWRNPCTNPLEGSCSTSQTSNSERNFMKWLMIWIMLILFPQNVNSSRQEALLKIFEDNEAVIKMIIKGRSPTLRHISRTHRVAFDGFFDRINVHPKIQIKYIDTKNQLADILTKGNFTRDEWNHHLCLFNISHFSPTNCL